MATLLNTLLERGMVHACTRQEVLAQDLNHFPLGGRWTVYAGFDPTADSLHLGHLVPVMALSHFQKAGHRVLVLVGGATAMVGDPSGKSAERNLLTAEQVEHNVQGVRKQLERFLAFDGTNPAIIVNNLDWIGQMSFLDWLRQVGKHFTIAEMLAKESVDRRLKSEAGISFTEFSYQTMQAFDFLHLFEKFGCTLQIGGSDQWGNITAGIELIRKVKQKLAIGLTLPLVTTASGEKFGKSAGNAIWLDPARTSPWDFYQYLVRQEDADVVRLLKLYTLLPLDEIKRLEASVNTTPEKREAQKALAFEVTRLVHGEPVAREMEHASSVVFSSEIKGISDETLAAVFASVPAIEITSFALEAGVELSALLVATQLATSKNKARQLLSAGGIYVNNVRAESDLKLGRQNLASPSFLVLRCGKKNRALVRVR